MTRLLVRALIPLLPVHKSELAPSIWLFAFSPPPPLSFPFAVLHSLQSGSSTSAAPSFNQPVSLGPSPESVLVCEYLWPQVPLSIGKSPIHDHNWTLHGEEPPVRGVMETRSIASAFGRICVAAISPKHHETDRCRQLRFCHCWLHTTRTIASRRWPDNDDTPRATKHDEHRDPPVIPAPELWPARLLQH